MASNYQQNFSSEISAEISRNIGDDQDLGLYSTKDKSDFSSEISAEISRNIGDDQELGLNSSKDISDFSSEISAEISRNIGDDQDLGLNSTKDKSDSPRFPERRIVVVGKTGAGKSTLANTLLGEKMFTADNSPSSVTVKCQSATKEVMNTKLTLIDTPAIFETESEKETRTQISSFIEACSPGVHAFLIVLQVKRYSEQEDEVVTRIFKHFSEDLLKYSVLVFTHGNQLEKLTIKKFVGQNKKLKVLVEKCSGRCHVFDFKYWKNDDNPEEYRRNSYQRMELLNTVETLVTKNSVYTNEMLQKAQEKKSNAQPAKYSNQAGGVEAVRKDNDAHGTRANNSGECCTIF